MLWAVSTSAESPIVYGRFRPYRGNCQRARQASGQFVGACGLVCRRGAHVNRKGSHEVGALERREGQQSMRCRKTCGSRAKVTEMLGTGCSTLRLARSEDIQLVALTGGYCWRICFKVLAVLFLAKVC